MSSRTASAMAPTEARKHANALRSVSWTLRENIRLRLQEIESCRDPEERKNKYVHLWESAAATCDDAASYLDEIDLEKKEARHE